jgi:transglutaminase-like putative cysteine protease
MRAGGRSPILAVALVLTTGVLGLGTGPSMALAQAAVVSPMTATTAASLFAMPTAADLAAAGTVSVVDTPAELPDTVDLAPVIEASAAAVAALPAAQWEVEALAKTLTDPTAAFDLVRDSIRFDPYPGVLRGANGTLAARAGNAFDRALLLKALLDAQGVTSRFAFGQLSPDIAAALVGRALEGPAVALPSPGFSPFDEAFEQAASNRARRDYALLSDALGDRIAGLAADATDASIADATSHAWVQVELPDGSWLDLDPSLADAQPGTALATADTTADVMPEAHSQTMTLRVIAESLAEGALSEATVLEAVLPASGAGHIPARIER